MMLALWDFAWQTGYVGVVAFDIDAEILRPIHTGVHHKYSGFKRCALTRFENHRFDG